VACSPVAGPVAGSQTLSPESYLYAPFPPAHPAGRSQRIARAASTGSPAGGPSPARNGSGSQPGTPAWAAGPRAPRRPPGPRPGTPARGTGAARTEGRPHWGRDNLLLSAAQLTHLQTGHCPAVAHPPPLLTWISSPPTVILPSTFFSMVLLRRTTRAPNRDCTKQTRGRELRRGR
jgi:hypothetical protein